MATQIDTANWMASLPANRRLVDTFIPGSHDSSAYFGESITGATTQSGNYTQQLQAGIRFFDVRCQKHLGKIYLHHGMVNGDKFSDVLNNQIVPFLKDNEKEIIIMDVDFNDDIIDDVLGIITECIPDSWLAREHLDDRGVFKNSTTWGDLYNGIVQRRVIITCSSSIYTNTTALFGDFSGNHTTPTLAKFNESVFMCLLDHDNNIYLPSSHDPLNWINKNDLPNTQILKDWDGPRNHSVPTIIGFKDKLILNIIDNDGSLYMAASSDGINWPDKSQMLKLPTEQQQPCEYSANMAIYNDNLYFAYISTDGTVCISKSSDGTHINDYDPLNLPDSNPATAPFLVEYNNHFYMYGIDNNNKMWVAYSDDPMNNGFSAPTYILSDWNGNGTVPTLAFVPLSQGVMMFLLDQNGALYYALSTDAMDWPPASEILKNRLFGDWSGEQKPPSILLYDTSTNHGAYLMCRLSNPGNVNVTISEDGANWYTTNRSATYNWLSFNQSFRWDPYDDFDKHSLDEILEFLNQYVSKWNKNLMFVAQVVDTPKVSVLKSPENIEDKHGAQMNDWVKSLNSSSNVNIILRDFVNNYPDTIQHIINMNF